ncbi:hypothetical protein [Acidicapsa ligni]|nr:hypothetical protein [Acidicapsa ligni]
MSNDPVINTASPNKNASWMTLDWWAVLLALLLALLVKTGVLQNVPW